MRRKATLLKLPKALRSLQSLKVLKMPVSKVTKVTVAKVKIAMRMVAKRLPVRTAEPPEHLRLVMGAV